MIYVSIDTAKDKHDCVIIDADGVVLVDNFTFSNNMGGFDFLLEKINSVADRFENVKIGVEATGHYNYNILGFLTEKGLDSYVLNPLHTNLYRKGISLRKTKTDKVDASTIAIIITSKQFLKSYNENLKSLTRYRFDLVAQREKLHNVLSILISQRNPLN